MDWRSPSGNDTPEHEGKATRFAASGRKGGRPRKVVVTQGRPRDPSTPTQLELADPATYVRFKKRLQNAVLVAEERKVQVARLRERLEVKQAELEQALCAAAAHASSRPLNSLVVVDPHVADYIDTVVMSNVGVSAQKMPLLNSLMSIKYCGAVSKEDISAPTTYTGMMRTGGRAVQLELIAEMQDAGYCFIQNDESGRAGSQLSCTTVSFLKEDDLTPKVALLELDVLPKKDAPTIASSVIAAIDLATPASTDDEGEFNALVNLAEVSADVAAHGLNVVGFASDNAATMCGKRGGVGALLASHLGHFLRHDTCLEHIHALLLAVFAQIFGDAKMNEISVAQWLYLCWYVCNKDWSLIRGLMVKHLASTSGPVMEGELEPPVVQEAEEDTPSGPGVTKCVQPNWLRWGSVAQAARWVKRWLPIVLLAFCDAYNFADETPAGSLATMGKQFVDWSQSSQLRAQFGVLLDWIDLLVPFELELRCKTIHGFANVFRAPFALDWYRRVDEALARWKSSPHLFNSFAELVAAYPEKDVTCVWAQFAELATDCLERNLLNIWGGLHALGAFADPAMASFVFEAVMHVMGDENAPKQRTPLGLELQEWILHPSIVDDQHRAAWDKVVTLEFRRGLLGLHNMLLVEGCDAFVATFKAPSTSLVVRFYQQQVFPVVNVMTPAERTFSGVDFVSLHHSLYVKRDAAAPAQAKGRIDTLKSLINVCNATAAIVLDCSRTYQEEKGLDQSHLSQAKSVAIAAATAIVAGAPSADMWKEAKKSRSGQREKWRRSQGGLSGSDQIAVDGLLGGGVRRREPLSLDTANEIAVPINTLCFHDGRCLHGRRKTRGKQAFLECKGCEAQFHKSCVEAAGLHCQPFYCHQTQECSETVVEGGAIENAATGDEDADPDSDEPTPISRKQRARSSNTAGRSQGKKRGR
jgi:hypothetical protein